MAQLHWFGDSRDRCEIGGKSPRVDVYIPIANDRNHHKQTLIFVPKIELHRNMPNEYFVDNFNDEFIEIQQKKELDMRVLSILGLLLFAFGCASVSTDTGPVHTTSYTPREAVMLAADAAPEGVPGVYEMIVTATGESKGAVFLNSEEDYRDQRNLTVGISPKMRAFYTEKFGEDPIEYFKGKRIAVRGVARRVRIDFVDKEDQPTGKYYYQTHVRVQHPNDISEL